MIDKISKFWKAYISFIPYTFLNQIGGKTTRIKTSHQITGTHELKVHITPFLDFSILKCTGTVLNSRKSFQQNFCNWFILELTLRAEVKVINKLTIHYFNNTWS